MVVPERKVGARFMEETTREGNDTAGGKDNEWTNISYSSAEDRDQEGSNLKAGRNNRRSTVMSKRRGRIERCAGCKVRGDAAQHNVKTEVWVYNWWRIGAGLLKLESAQPCMQCIIEAALHPACRI